MWPSPGTSHPAIADSHVLAGISLTSPASLLKSLPSFVRDSVLNPQTSILRYQTHIVLSRERGRPCMLNSSKSTRTRSILKNRSSFKLTICEHLALFYGSRPEGNPALFQEFLQRLKQLRPRHAQVISYKRVLRAAHL